MPPANALEEEAIAKSIDAQVEEITTRVMTAEHLVAIALKIGRAKDYARIEDFLKQKAINVNKLKAILSRHGLAGKWETFQREHHSR